MEAKNRKIERRQAKKAKINHIVLFFTSYIP